MSNAKDTQAIATIVTAVLASMGIGNSIEPNVKSSARVIDTPDVSHMKAGSKKGKRLEDVTITLTDAMIDGRMKLPARMFNGRSIVKVDGHELTQQPEDNNRSTKFNPAIFGDVAEGDTITFRHLGQNSWTVDEIEAGSRKRKSTSRPAQAKSTSKKATAKPKSDSDYVPFHVPDEARKSPKALVKFFAEVARENAENIGSGEFEPNPNIIASMKQAGRDEDARVFLSSQQQQKFRKIRKEMGLGLTESIEMLNELVPYTLG